MQANKLFTLQSHKSCITNIIAIIVILIGVISDLKYSEIVLNIGFFAFSGAITNWLAVYMLFEKIPFLYGSGVIERRFHEFKQAIKNLLLEEFFTKENIKQFLDKKDFSFNLEKLEEKVDFEKIFADLTEVILTSPLGAMINMVGGKETLSPIKQPVILKLQEIMHDIIKDLENSQAQISLTDKLYNEVVLIIDNRLNQLTPQAVKIIVQKMIREHLGWLVVWGGVFGAIIGFTLALIS